MTVHRIVGGQPVRTIAGMTFADVAKHLGVARATVYRWHENGDKLFLAWAQERDRSARLRAACEDLDRIRKRLEGEA